MSRPSLWCACSAGYANPLLLQTESEHCSETQSCCVASQALSGWVCSVITHKIQFMLHFSVYYSYRQETPLDQNIPSRRHHFNHEIKILLLFPTEHFFRKLRDCLAETNSWSYPQGTKQQDSSGLQNSLKLWVRGLAVTQTAALTEVTSWQALELCSSHSHLPREAALGLSDGKELKQCWGRDKHLEGAASWNSRRPDQLFLLMDQSQTKMFSLFGPDHKPVISETEDKQQWLHWKKAFRLNWHLPTGTCSS